MAKKFSTLQVALAVSIGIHGALLALRFVDPEGFNRMFEDTPLEVILVNARSNEAPTKAQAIAQRNLAGGGDFDRGMATSPLTASPTTTLGDSADDAYKQIDRLQQTQQQLLAQVRRELATLPPPDPQRDRGDPNPRAEEERRRQLLELLAQIEKRINEENSRPKKRYISPATREAVYSVYTDRLVRKIEERGTRSFPEHKGRKLYGELVMLVTVDAAGRVIETEIVQSSGNAILDKRARMIARAAGPFGNFTPEMRKEAEQLVFSRRFKFTRDEELQTTADSAVGMRR